ncbi:hypothetical protein TWF694_004012 [Orbilia ellipsospora]|uniref:Large ribosomal subunit protein P1 n=1 Tax=Orbilia ellipsospora TaxID=2528407 RepID=A0AAV9WY36_9PEZI
MAYLDRAVAYAALVLADEGVQITPEKLQTLLSAAKVDVEPIWTVLFTKALEGKDIKGILLDIRAGAPVAAASGAVVTTSSGVEDGKENGDKSSKEGKKKKEEVKEDSDDDMGFGLFD